MDWNEIRLIYPAQWLLVEAIKAKSEKGRRILEDISVINSFPNAVAAMNDYRQIKFKTPHRELFVLHTDRINLDILERKWLGIRGI
ncbi:hypothetical protein MHK_010280 [Candidatus Magnetomorum sp. HK-1]|nr:hypothetical protein MHK_010280 [Candidatus Magnetomorum sp. HK-1]